MQVTIGIPTQWGLWRDEMGLSLIRALGQLDARINLSPQKGPYLDMNREASAKEAVDLKSDYLLFVDTDMVFPADAFVKLLAHKKDIVGANYYEKRFPLVSTVKLAASNGDIADDGKMVEHAFPNEPFECAGVGGGLMVVNVARMTQTMSPPFFAFADHKGQRMGEELSFTTRARKAGMQVWCDPTIPVLHVGDFLYGKLRND